MVRQAASQLKAGTTVVAFQKLPGWTDEGSVRIALTPANSGRIADVRVERSHLAQSRDKGVLKAREAVEKLSDESAAGCLVACTAADPSVVTEMERLVPVLMNPESRFQLVLYEMATRMHPDMMLLRGKENWDDMRKFIKDHVVVDGYPSRIKLMGRSDGYK